MKDKQLNIRISEIEQKALKEKARVFGFKTVTEYVRVCVFNAAIVVEAKNDT